MMASFFKSKNINAVVIAASTHTPEEVSELMAKYGMQVSDSACADKVFKMAVKTKNVTALGTLVKLKVDKTVLNSALFECVEADFQNGAEVLVRAGVDVNVTDLKGNTALMMAVKMRSMNSVQYLLEIKADANLVNKSKHTALSLACKNGQSGIVEKLVQFGAFWDTRKATNARQYNHHLITCAKLMKKCSAHGINSKDGRGYTLLMYAAQTGCAKTVRVLLGYGADVNQLDHEGGTALMHVFNEYLRSSLPFTISTQTISTECVQLLCGESVSIQDESGQTALIHALVSKKDISEEIITCLVGSDLSCHDRYYKTALIYAAQYKPRLIKTLLPYVDNKARSYQDREFMTALMYYLQNSEIELDVVRNLYSNSNASDLCGYTELMHAVDIGSEDCVKLLVSLGAVVESTDRRKRTALMMALDKEMSPDCLKCLVGRSVNMENEIGQTALAHARKSRDVEFLIQNGADLTQRDVNKQTVLMKSLKNLGHACSKEIMSLLIPCGVNAQDVDGRTALMYAAVSNLVVQIKDLVALGADVNLQDNDGLTALMMAFLPFTPFPCELVGILKGEDINIRDTIGNTALLHAVATAQCSPSVFSELVHHGADVQVVNLKGDSFFTLLVNTPIRRYEFYSAYNYRRNIPSALYIRSIEANRNKNLLLDEGETHFINATLQKYLSNRSACFIKACEKPNVLRVLLFHGIVPNHIFYLPETCNDLLKEYLTMKLKQEPARLTFYRISPLVTALVLGHTHVVKYLLANTCMELTDISELQKLQTLPVFSKISPEARSLISDITSNPWPLVKLAFLTLSTSIGFDGSRANRVDRIDIYPRIKKLLVFDTQTSRIPTRQWDDVRLSFKDEDLDRMRPILFTWPMIGLEVKKYTMF